MMHISPPDYTSRDWESLTIEMRAEVRGWLDAFRNRRRRDYSWPLATVLIGSAALALLFALARI